LLLLLLLFFFWLLFCWFPVPTHCEESLFKYDVTYHPALFFPSNIEPGSEIVEMVSQANGGKYKCIIPPPSVEDEPIEEIDFINNPINIPSLLAPLKTVPCLYRITAWWTYEFCFGSHIRQFHQEESKVVSQFYLGKKLVTPTPTPTPTPTHTSTKDELNNENEEQVNSLQSLVSDKHRSSSSQEQLPKYYSELYIDGDVCDITGEKRKTEVQYYCTGGDKSLISAINEPASCSYTLIVQTPLLCAHPFYLDKSESVPIRCYHVSDKGNQKRENPKNQ